MKAVFLDRDGVINEEKKDGYITSLEEFQFCKGACQAIALLSEIFDYVIIVTNQRGIGKGLMTEKELAKIHIYLKTTVEKYGGKIDAIYFAPQLEDDHPLRKPNVGMALQAKYDFHDIDFSQSVMVGNSLSDMQFGKSTGMQTVFLFTTKPPLKLPHYLVDEQFASLFDWAKAQEKESQNRKTV